MGRGEGMYETAARRWAGVGPYYAMFPVQFANRVVRRFTSPGDVVLDPFAGRGTAVFSAAAQGRRGIGVEINPVGWLYGRCKLRPSSKRAVLDRFQQLVEASKRYRVATHALPPFFHHCFDGTVLPFLLAARHELRWRDVDVDATAMALILVYLHGKRDASFSNQMRQTKSMSPDYAVRWWRKRQLKPLKIDPLTFVIKRLDWRYAKGVPDLADSRMYLGDSTRRLNELRRSWPFPRRRARLLFTSPPYYGLTNYHYDQWLRLWMLGGPPHARRVGGRHRGKFESRAEYRKLLYQVFRQAARLLRRDAVVYVRTGRQQVTYQTTLEVLRKVFPSRNIRRLARPFLSPTQTRLFGDTSPKVGEVDLIVFAR